jgi:uncharacterized membrane protein YphA (DoxX/SURF4 family)
MKNTIRQFLFGTSLNHNTTLNIGWLLFRLHIGLSIALGAGFPKMKDLNAPGWFAEQVGKLGFTFPSPAFWATMASWGEFVGGLCIALGLLTRFNAAQLAFQFFVVSFLWYDNPEPITGMYFQNTLFMCFLLIAFAGGGKYSLDNLFLHHKNIAVNKKLKPAITTIVLLLFSCVMVAQKPLNGSGVIISKNYDYTNFTSLSIKDVADAKVKISLGKNYKITAKVDDNLAEDFIVALDDKKLSLSIAKNRENKRYIEETNISIDIEMPDLENFIHSSNSNVLITNINNKQLAIKNTGNGSLTLEGNTAILNIKCSGNGNVNAKNLIAVTAEATARGNGNIYINAAKITSFNRTGNGNIINVFKNNNESNTDTTTHQKIAAKKVKLTVINKTNAVVRFKVQYYVSGTYGFSVQPNVSYTDFFPPKTKLYKGNSINNPKKLQYTVTEEPEQVYTIE